MACELSSLGPLSYQCPNFMLIEVTSHIASARQYLTTVSRHSSDKDPLPIPAFEKSSPSQSSFQHFVDLYIDIR
jgi:hypothetical protein